MICSILNSRFRDIKRTAIKFRESCYIFICSSYIYLQCCTIYLHKIIFIENNQCLVSNLYTTSINFFTIFFELSVTCLSPDCIVQGSGFKS